MAQTRESMGVESALTRPGEAKRGRYQAIAPRIVWAMLVPVCIYAIFATVKSGIDAVSSGASHLGTLAGGLVVLAICAIVWRQGRPLTAILGRFADVTSAVPARHWVATSLIVGALARIVWVLFFPAIFTSDFQSYWILANQLASKGYYYIAGTHAYWPPGLPFFLLPSLLAMGSHSWIPLLNNLVLFGATVAVVYRLAIVVSNERVARMAILLFVLWPNLIFYAGLPAKELLTAFLLPLAILFYFRAVGVSDMKSRSGFAFVAGLVIGFSSLTQASFLLFPSIFVLYEFIAKKSFSTSCGRLVLLVIGMVLVVVPWTLRNYFVLNAVVPVSTNGGWSLYIGNNPNASGAHVPAGTELQGYDEVTANKIALAKGVNWIVDNPGRFLDLAVKKQIIFLGDDSTGAFWTVKRGMGIGDIRYDSLKGVANLFWLGLLVLLLVGLIFQWNSPLSENPEILVLGLSIFYFLSLHSVFESGSRHHVALAGCLVILAAFAVQTSKSGTIIGGPGDE